MTYTIKYNYYQALVVIMVLVLGYGRVSTSEQALEANALENQLERLRRAGATKVFFDIDKRTNDRRKGMQQLMEAIPKVAKGTASCDATQLLFTRLDRVAASPLLFYELLNLCRQHKVELKALDEVLDFGSIGGELGIDVRLAAAKYEVRMTSLRVSKINSDRRSQGKAHYFAPFGYKVVADHYQQDLSPMVCLLGSKQVFSSIDLLRLEVSTFFEVRSVTATAKHLNLIFGIAIKGQSTRDREKDTNVWNTENPTPEFKTSTNKKAGISWSPIGLITRLQNPILAGGTPYDTRNEKGHRLPVEQWKIQWGTHDDQAIITPEEHYQIREIIKGNRNNKWAKAQPLTHPYSGLLRCNFCNAVMRIQARRLSSRTDGYESYYQCAYYDRGLCGHKRMIRDQLVDEKVTSLLIEKAEELAELISKPIQFKEPPEVNEIRQQICQMRAIGSNEVIETAIASLQRKIDDLLIKATGNENLGLLKKETLIKFMKDRELYQSMNLKDKTDFLRSIIHVIHVDNATIAQITYRF